MSDSHEKFSKEIDETQCGVILGCWDHEKTPTLIQDLEETVNLVKIKCIKLFEELVNYKKYLEESGEPDFHLVVLRRKSKKWKNSSYFSGSEPDITFRKTLFNFQEVQQGFVEKFKAKLCCINSELTKAAKKMGLKENVILLPLNDYPKAQFENETEKCWKDLQENLIKLNLVQSKTKSDLMLIKNPELEFSKITKDELELYQKLSRLSMKRKKKERKLSMKTIKFRAKRRTPGHRQQFLEWKHESNQPKPRKKGQKLRKSSRTTPPKSISSSTSDSFLEPSLDKLNITEAEKKSQSLCEVLDNKNMLKSRDKSKGRGLAEEIFGTSAKRTPSTFTVCASTSMSHNPSLNTQRRRHRKKSKISSWEVAQTKESEESTKAEAGRNILWSLDSKSGHFENEVASHLKQENSPSAHERLGSLRKARSRYTGRSPEGFLLGHKSTMSRYTSGQKSMFKSESSTAYMVGSKIMVSDCQRTDVFQFRTNNSHENASGDGACVQRCDKLNTEWTKAYDCFLSMHRKYALLKKKLTGADPSFSDDELKSLESELDYSIEKYKDFLQFYSKFLQLSHRLKSLKMTCESKMIGPSSYFSSKCSGKLCTYKSNYSITMKKALREVQALQDKIKLVNA